MKKYAFTNAIPEKNGVNAGFTIIELLVVFSIIAILGAVSVASYSSFNTAQMGNSAVSDVVAFIKSARSNAISQVKPAQCINKTLNGYKVVITLPDQYELDVICDTSSYIIGNPRKLSQNVTFVNNPAPFFIVSSGTVAQPVIIFLNANGKNYQITINATGIISVQP